MIPSTRCRGEAAERIGEGGEVVTEPPEVRAVRGLDRHVRAVRERCTGIRHTVGILVRTADGDIVNTDSTTVRRR